MAFGYGLGNLLQYHLGRYEESETAYRRAIELDASYAYPWHELGNLLRDHLGRRDEAGAAHREALAIKPENPTTLNGLAWHLFVVDGDLDEAETLSSKAVELKPEEPVYVQTLAEILVRRGKWHQGLQACRRWLQFADEDHWDRYWRSIVEFFRDMVRAGHANDAVEMLDETGHGERWRPMREALRAAADDDPAAYLQRIAPEVRQPAQEILDLLLEEPRPTGEPG